MGPFSGSPPPYTFVMMICADLYNDHHSPIALHNTWMAPKYIQIKICNSLLQAWCKVIIYNNFRPSYNIWNGNKSATTIQTEMIICPPSARCHMEQVSPSSRQDCSHSSQLRHLVINIETTSNCQKCMEYLTACWNKGIRNKTDKSGEYLPPSW